MTLPTTAREAGPYLTDGVSTSFAFAFKSFGVGYQKVIRTDLAAGIEIELGYGSAYSVVLNADQDSTPGGNVLVSPALPVGYAITIRSAVPFDQPVDLPPSLLTLEGAFDRVVALIKQVVDEGVTPAPEVPGSQPPVNWEMGGIVNKLWTYRIPAGAGTFSSPIGPIDLAGVPSIVFTSLDGYAYAIKVSDGTLVWRTATADECYGRCQAANVDATNTSVFVPSHDGYIWRLDAAGAMVWKFPNLYAREGTGTSTAGTGATTLVDSTKAWAANAFLRLAGATYGASLTYTSGAAVGQTKEITASPGGTTLTHAAFSPAPSAGDTYEIVPRYVSDVYWQHAGTLVNEAGTYYLYAVGFDNHVYKINAASGALVWKYATLENMEPYPVVATVSSVLCVFTVSVDGFTRCQNAADGTVIWAAATGACDAFIHVVDIDASGDLEVTVASRNGRVYILDATTGAVQWTSTNTRAWDYGDLDCSAVPVVLPGQTVGRVVTGGDAGTVYCFDDEMNTLWERFLLPNVINASPVFHQALGTSAVQAIVGDHRGTIHAIDVATGVYAGTWHIKGTIEGIPLYGDIDGDGRVEIVFTTNDGYVTCYRFVLGGVWAQPGVPGNTQWRGYQAV